VVAKRAHSGAIVVATGKKGLAVTVKAAPSRFRLGERVSVVGTRVHVLSRVKTARIRGMVVKRLAHSVRVASGRSVLTIHTQGRSLASHGDGHEGEMGEFEVEFEHDGLFEHDFTPVSRSGTVEIEGTLVSVSPLVVSLEGLPVEIAVPSSVTLPALTPGQEVELTVQTGAGNTFTLVSIDQAENEVGDEVEAKGAVTNSTASQITIDAGDASLTFAAPTGKTLPILATGTQVEARGVTINGVLTLTRLRTDDDGDGGGSGGGGGGDH
jgi:FtsP/CotA-like multicopper oxidase with cupredoxin domain